MRLRPNARPTAVPATPKRCPEPVEPERKDTVEAGARSLKPLVFQGDAEREEEVKAQRACLRMPLDA